MLRKIIINRSQAAAIHILFYAALLTAIITNVYADMGDDLRVTGTVVNLRKGPSINEAVLLQLSQGTRVVEISRFEEWVEVTIDRDDIQVGWIHATLLEAENSAAQDEGDKSGHFQRFKTGFDKFKNDHLSEDGITHFSDISTEGGAALQLTATDEWFELPMEKREEVLAGIFRLWKESAESGTRVSVEVVDKNKEVHMIIFR